MATIRAADGGYLLNSDQFNYTKDAQGRPVLNVVGGGGGGNVQADWSQNDAQAADFVKNRPGAYMSEPVATEIYNGILPEMASIQMDYVPSIGDVVTVKVGTESLDCTVGDFNGFPYFATVPIEGIAGGTATNYVFCLYRASQWFAQTAGTYTGQSAVFEGMIRQAVKIPEKFLELENVKDVYWIKFAFDQETKMYASQKLDGTYAEYADIKAAIDNGKLVAAVASVFGESNNVGLIGGYGKYVNDMSVSFYNVYIESGYLMKIVYFRWKSGHIWEKIESEIPSALKNPYSLNIKIGNDTTTYDGSAAKTVEIPEGVPAFTTADNDKVLGVVNGALAWVTKA